MNVTESGIHIIVKAGVNDVISSERRFQELMKKDKIPWAAKDFASDVLVSIYTYLRNQIFHLKDVYIDRFGVFSLDLETENMCFREDEALRQILETGGHGAILVDRLDDDLLKKIISEKIELVYDARTGAPEEAEMITDAAMSAFTDTLLEFLACGKLIDLRGLGKFSLTQDKKILYEPTSLLLETLRVGKKSFNKK